MPSRKISDAASEPAREFSVVGHYSTPDYVGHVSLLRAARPLRFGDWVEVDHMRPPFEASGRAPAHVLGWVEGLTADEVKGLRTWLEDMRLRFKGLPERHQRLAYIVDPPFREDLIYGWACPRFSCAGFVLKCYQDALGLTLLDWQSPAMPRVGRDLIRTIYGPELAEMLDKHGPRLGAPPPGPWRIVLPAYVLHALARRPDEIRASPYVPSGREVRFP